jgi:hypothetical protein
MGDFVSQPKPHFTAHSEQTALDQLLTAYGGSQPGMSAFSRPATKLCVSALENDSDNLIGLQGALCNKRSYHFLSRRWDFGIHRMSGGDAFSSFTVADDIDIDIDIVPSRTSGKSDHQTMSSNLRKPLSHYPKLVAGSSGKIDGVEYGRGKIAFPPSANNSKIEVRQDLTSKFPSA